MPGLPPDARNGGACRETLTLFQASFLKLSHDDPQLNPARHLISSILPALTDKNILLVVSEILKKNKKKQRHMFPTALY